MADSCVKHGPHAPGECPQCDELVEARSIVATTYIPPAPQSSKQKSLREAAQALADRMPKGANALNSFHARREVIELRRALEHSADETSCDEDPADTARLDFIEEECVELRCKESRNHDDADVYYEVVRFYMALPHEKVVGYGSTPRGAIDYAMENVDDKCAYCDGGGCTLCKPMPPLEPTPPHPGPSIDKAFANSPRRVEPAGAQETLRQSLDRVRPELREIADRGNTHEQHMCTEDCKHEKASACTWPDCECSPLETGGSPRQRCGRESK